MSNVLVVWVPESAIGTFDRSLADGSWGFPNPQSAPLEPGDHVLFAHGVARGPRQPAQSWSSATAASVWHGVATTSWYEDHKPRHSAHAFPYRFDFTWLPPILEDVALDGSGAFSAVVSDAMRQAGISNSAHRVVASGSLFGEAAPSPAPRLDWTREEVILAMDLYVSSGALGGGSIPGKTSSVVGELSALLKALAAYPAAVQGDKYRNPEGVYLKLTNFRAIESEGKHGMNAFSQLDAATWREFIDDLPRLHDEAKAIRLRLAEHALVPASNVAVVTNVPIEQHNTERYLVHPSGEMRTSERAEQGLVTRYRDWMATRGAEVVRRRYVPRGEVFPIFCDAWIEDRQVLIEAKNSDSRESIRSAIGQLYDYRRFHTEPPKLGVLLPYPPNLDRQDLLSSAGIEAVWPHGSGFRATAPFLT